MAMHKITFVGDKAALERGETQVHVSRYGRHKTGQSFTAAEVPDFARGAYKHWFLVDGKVWVDPPKPKPAPVKPPEDTK
jgi:hypothetical protein